MNEASRVSREGASRAELIVLARRLAELADSLVADSDPERAGQARSDRQLARVASAILRGRRARRRHLPPELFAEPAWDLLLDLFVHQVEGTRPSTTGLCMRSDVPAPTGLRWLEALGRHGLVRRTQSARDSRLKCVELTEEGMAAMRATIPEWIFDDG